MFIPAAPPLPALDRNTPAEPPAPPPWIVGSEGREAVSRQAAGGRFPAIQYWYGCIPHSPD
jgi:hypothetical protein